MKNWKYTRVRCSGDIEKFSIPAFIQPEEVAKKIPHSLLFVFIPKSRQVICRESLNYFSNSWAHIDETGCKQVSKRPENDTEAYNLIRN